MRAPRNVVLLSAAGVVAVVLGIGTWTHWRLQREVEGRVRADLQVVVSTATRAVTTFLAGAERLTGVAVRTPEVRAAAVGSDPRRALAPYFGSDRSAAGYVATDSSGIVLDASDGLASRGDLLPARICPVAAAARSRTPTAGLPFRAPNGRVYLLVVAAIPDSEMFLALAFDNQELTGPLLAARAGRSGETYAVDARGLMISSSRFAQQLRAAGFSGVDAADTTFGVALREPGGDVTEGFRPAASQDGGPLTFAAGRVIAAEDGVRVTPYPDYRGVPVVGAWTWLAARGFGIISEVDAAEAFRPLRVLERIFAVLLALLAVAVGTTVMGWLLAQRAAQRALRAEAVARRMGQYVVERKLGSGATGDVYLARHVLLRRPTALKLLREHRTDTQSLERFEREVQVTAAMVHPQHRRDLRLRPQRRRVLLLRDGVPGRDGPGTLRDAVRPVSRGARHPHPAPGVRLAGGGARARARASRHQAGEHLPVPRGRAGLGQGARLRPGAGLGFADGHVVGRRAGNAGDHGARAVRIVRKRRRRQRHLRHRLRRLHLLTGQNVFSGSSLAELCNAHLSKAPVPPSVRLGRAVDATLEHALIGCLAKRPGNRPRSAAELAALLGEAQLPRAWSRADAAAFWAAHADVETAEAPAESVPMRKSLRADRLRAR